jgi:fermentation-respiration switch protein FrsA (DUF1100 family)
LFSFERLLFMVEHHSRFLNMASIGFSIIKGAFALTSHVAPRLTGRAAFELFCRTADPKRVSPREARVLGESAPFMAMARRHVLDTRFREVLVHEFDATGGEEVPSALVIHGWRSRSEHMRHIVDGLLGRGFRVLALDLPGHGGSAGRRLNMALAVAAVTAVADRFGSPQVLVGHSFGGAVAVNAAVGSVAGLPPVAAERLVLIAAPSSMPAIFDDFGRFLGLEARAQMALADQVLRVAGRPLEDFVGEVQLRDHPLPTLVVHAPDDKEIAFDNALRFEAAGSHVRVMRAPGRGHRRILADSEVVSAVADFATVSEDVGAWRQADAI